MSATRPQRLILVYAMWCPHCAPLSLDRVRSLGETLGVPVRLLDIDVRAEETVADRLVQVHGDWDPDYLIPQLFLEWTDGSISHVLTGIPGSVAATGRLWDRLLADPAGLVARGPGAPPAR